MTYSKSSKHLYTANSTVPAWYIQGVPGGMVNFGRVFLMLNYTDITQNTYIQSWTVTEIIAREKCGLLAGSTYCTCTAGWHVTLISHVLESVTYASSQWVGMSALSAYREWRCGELYIRMCGFCNVWVRMYGFCNVCVLVICIPALLGYPDWGKKSIMWMLSVCTPTSASTASFLWFRRQCTWVQTFPLTVWLGRDN